MSGDKGLNPIIVSLCRFGGIASVLLAIIFLINNFIDLYWRRSGCLWDAWCCRFFGFEAPKNEISGGLMTLGWVQVLTYIGALAVAGYYTKSQHSLVVDADRLDRMCLVHY